jgi:hypothetical protein
MSKIKVENNPYPGLGRIGLYSQTAAGAAVVNTTDETTLLNGGVGTLTVPANAFKVGDTYRVDMGGKLSANNNEGLTIRVKSGAVVLASTGVVTMAGATDRSWIVSVDFVIRSVGVATVAAIYTSGFFEYLKNASSNLEFYNASALNNTTFDTTVSNTLDITAQWSVASPGNSITTENFNLYKIY